jgi:membrane associated rhomboid family serine protease
VKGILPVIGLTRKLFLFEFTPEGFPMFIVLPVGMNYRTERLPVVTLTLIGINTLVYLASLFFFFSTSGESELWIYHHLWLTPVNSILWTYLTSMFVHAGFFHLLGNMIFLFLFGCCVEDIIGYWRFLVFYLVGGLVAELAFIALIPDHFASAIPMGGASGAISTCMGMYLLLRAKADIEFKYFILFFGANSGDFSLPAWMAISFWFLKDLFWAVLGFVNQHASGGVAFGAHVGGFLAGFGLIGIYKIIERSRGKTTTDKIIRPGPIRVFVPARSETSTVETPTIYLHDGGAQSGPFTMFQIEQMLAVGSISRDALYWSEGMSDWGNVSELSCQPSG